MDNNIGLGMCECGCGERTTAAGNRFVHGHNSRQQPKVGLSAVGQLRRAWKRAGIPYGKCLCGCGQSTALAVQGVRRLGYIKGEPVFYVRGHANRKRVQYLVEDRGYESPCWIGQYWLSREGYCQMSDGTGVQRPAHRVMWERVNGPIPVGLHLDHLCFQPSCINPDHLEPVTPAVNARRSSTAKLDWPKVRQIRQRLAEGATHRELAEAHGVCVATVSHIASGRNWRE